MTISNTFSFASQVFQELILAIEEQKKKASRKLPASKISSAVTLPNAMTLEDLIAQNPTLPNNTLLLGMANDGSPILVNLYEPAPDPVLVLGDSSVGKTSLMQSLARATDLIQDPSDIQFGVISNHPDEWQALDASPGSLGV